MGGGTSAVFQWLPDILMSSFYHAEYKGNAVVDGSKWCSQFYTKFDGTTGDEITATATNGLDGKSKCTWQFIAKDQTKAPTILMKTLNF